MEYGTVRYYGNESSYRKEPISTVTMSSLSLLALLVAWCVSATYSLTSFHVTHRLLAGSRGKPTSNTRLSAAGPDASVWLYDLQLRLANAVAIQTDTVSVAGVGILYLAGLLASLSPCSLGLLPLTLAYLGKTSDETDNSSALQLKLSSYTIGFASALSLLGLSAASIGNIFGSTNLLGDIPELIAALVSLFMGFYLLNIVNFNFPSLEKYLPNIDETNQNNPFSAFLFGLSTALIASPCSSPVLASLLGLIAAQGATGSPWIGGLLLFAYSLGYATPLVAAGNMSGVYRAYTASNTNSSWINVVFASIFICYGTYRSLDLLI